MKLFRLLPAAALGLLSACTALPGPSARVLILNDGVPESVTWLPEARTRFKDPIIVAAHGCTVRGQWMLACTLTGHKHLLPVEDVAALVHKLYPDHAIVLIICNPDGLVLHVHDVYYPTHCVLTRPDSAAGHYQRLWDGNNQEIVLDRNIGELVQGQ